MNAIKISILLFIFPLICSAQLRDVYFLIEMDNLEYIIPNRFNEKLSYISLIDKKEYEYNQKKIKEAKEKGEYYFNQESGKDNLKVKVSKLTFKIISSKKIDLTDCEISKLNLINYDWLKENSWKKIAKQSYDFKNIYFLYQIKKGVYILYNVSLTIIEH
jgi:hypothetical protein